MFVSGGAVALDGGDIGGGGGGGRSDSGGGGRGDRGDGDDGRTVEQVLARSGLSRDELPLDVQAAIAAGRLSLAELRNYARVLQNPALRALASTGAFLRDRLIASPHLATVIGVETGVGLCTTMIAEASARAGRLLAEADFILCDLALVVATNIALVVALSPAAAVGGAPTGALRRALAKLPAGFLQAGPFTPTQRLGCYLMNAAQFGSIGVASATLGATATKSLVAAREKLTGQRPDVQLAPIKSTALAYGSFVAVSSATRYQLVNAIESSVFSRLPMPTGALSTVLRTGNNYIGGFTWILWARFLGVQ
ncbi:hypothetical protein KFE25_008033 [Diacronema lutheri]|uniref:Uncharacterized protein n=2 Tax=Diacronema lutheri TaxID=2081491 RepID=A0A8J5XU88_DIALT|nr:hypothetical protein KFE25_008033 [Diacronema lutheri]